MSTIRDEQDAIRNLARDLTDMKSGLDVHYNDCGSAATGIAAFQVVGGESETLFIENLHDWDMEEAYLPRLRLLRHKLEEMHKEALAESRGEAA